MTSKAERSPEGLCESLAAAINQSGLKPEILTPEWLPRSRFLKAFEEVLYQGFKTLGLGVRKEVENPFIVAWQAEHPDRRISRQRADYILTRDHTVAAILEVESLDRAQVNTFMCQYYDWDNGKRDYYWLTLDHLVHHPEISPPGMFVFVLALPDCSVSRYQIWDTSDPYYGVSQVDCAEIFRSPYRFYDSRIKLLLRQMLLDQDPESTPDSNWIVQNRCLAEYQHICELIVVTLTGPEILLARGRDLFASERETRYRLSW